MGDRRAAVARLPRIIRLPGGFIIEVKQRRLSGSWGTWNYDMNTGVGVIEINSKADLARKWRTLAHELLHAAGDYEHWVEEMKARPIEVAMGQTAAELTDKGD